MCVCDSSIIEIIITDQQQQQQQQIQNTEYFNNIHTQKKTQTRIESNLIHTPNTHTQTKNILLSYKQNKTEWFTHTQTTTTMIITQQKTRFFLSFFLLHIQILSLYIYEMCV